MAKYTNYNKSDSELSFQQLPCGSRRGKQNIIGANAVLYKHILQAHFSAVFYWKRTHACADGSG